MKINRISFEAFPLYKISASFPGRLCTVSQRTDGPFNLNMLKRLTLLCTIVIASRYLDVGFLEKEHALYLLRSLRQFSKSLSLHTLAHCFAEK